MNSFLFTITSTRTCYVSISFYRGVVHCLKLSPNLRKQTKGVRSALLNKDKKKALELEVKKLNIILAMVKDQENIEKEETEEEYDPLK